MPVSASYTTTGRCMETPAPDILAEVVEKLAAAERPVIVAGRGAIMAGAKEELIKLGERTGALLATSLQGKSLFAGHEWNVGISGAFASEPTERLLAEADFVLGVGAELGYYTTEGGLMFPSAEVARIDIKPMPEEIGVIPGLYVQADAKKAVAALNEALEGRQIRKTGLRTAETRAILDAPDHQFTPPTDGLDPRALGRKLGAAIPKGALITCGAGHFFSWVASYMPMPEGSEIQFSYNFGAVGQGLGVMVGTAVGNPGRKHVAIEGDGSMMFNIQELETIVREKLDITLVVWNDGGYGAEVHKLTAKGFNEKLAQWESPDFVAVAKAFEAGRRGGLAAVRRRAAHVRLHARRGAGTAGRGRFLARRHGGVLRSQEDQVQGQGHRRFRLRCPDRQRAWTRHRRHARGPDRGEGGLHPA